MKHNLTHVQTLLILFPLLYLLHDIEEIVTIEQFLITQSDTIPFRVSTLGVAFSFLWILATIGCYQTVLGKKFLGMKPTTYLSFLVPGIISANGVGHIIQFFVFREYVPGIITTIVVLLPYSFFAGKYLLHTRQITVRKLGAFFLLGFVFQVPLALAAHFLSKLILTL
ncbi:HXXEE domain-containing protein [Ferdinandcohnia sp. Marseille-Q9671]